MSNAGVYEQSTHTGGQTDTHKQKTLEQVAKDKNSTLFKVKI